MTRKEYRRFIKQYELIGNIEMARKNKHHVDKRDLSQFLIFLEQIFVYHRKNHPSVLANNLDIKILVRKTLNKLAQDAFDNI